jgi:hypothetical protein
MSLVIRSSMNRQCRAGSGYGGFRMGFSMMLSDMRWPQEPSGASAERGSEFSFSADDRNSVHRPPSFAAALTIATVPARPASGSRSEVSTTVAKPGSAGSTLVAFSVTVKGWIRPDTAARRRT